MTERRKRMSAILLAVVFGPVVLLLALWAGGLTDRGVATLGSVGTIGWAVLLL